MKKVFLAIIAVSLSLSVHAGLQKIDEDKFFIEDNRMNISTEALSLEQVKGQFKTDDYRLNQINHSQTLATNAVVNANMQTMTSALPQIGSDGIKIQLPEQTISYGTINMGMGDFANGSAFTKLPEFKK